MSALPDGTYDCIVVDVDEDDDGGARVHFAITAGARKGDTLTLRTSSLKRDVVDLLAAPATIEVVDGAPRVRW